ncbi:hypothetical protein BKA59DRAFT_441911 [Fusarium tricinctum]|uniref:Uncharacterized protein n=1 Tax=Fusarium tricinctum TaxID=61284 RepID=A0A8K0RV20_9HYPO|nr:hypothetical protein BKA59DRAFT_441911 [Fusarium tricinctum]
MSGIEVVGVVLAVLPLAIEALKAYKAMLSRVRGADRDLKALIQDLETEQVRLQTTCEVLLDGIAPLSRIDEIVKKPFEPEWEQFSDNIRERLWTTMNTFKEHARVMQEAAEELREKLCIKEDGQRRLSSSKAILEEYKKMASFSLRKKDYESIISRIKTANSVLHELADDNRKLEPSRRRRSQARVTRLIRGLSQSVFDGLRCAVKCRCVQSHDLCRSPSPRRRVRFLEMLGSKSRLESTSSEKTLTDVSKRTIVTNPSLFPSTASLPLLSSDLCQVLVAWYKEQGNPAAPCCGYIADPHRTFGLYPQNYFPEPSPTITLRQILRGEHNKFEELDILDRLKVTLAVSTNILHLYKPPWLARILTLDDIVFFQGNQKTAYHSLSPARPSITGIFVRMPVVAAPSEIQLPRKPRKPSKASNLIVLSLGALLIQVMIGRAEPALDMAAVPDTDLKAMMEKREAGFQWRNKVLEEVGDNYMMAVEWCLDNALGFMGLEDEEFCQNFYEGVVLRLEKDVQQLSSCVWE